jgi:signal transduction histidine kinase
LIKLKYLLPVTGIEEPKYFDSMKANFISIVVVLISILLVADILLTYYNNSIITKNRELQMETEKTKLYTEQIGKSTIHGVDIGLRGYAIIREPRFFTPVDSAFMRKDSILSNIETRLVAQGYPKLDEFRVLKDSLEMYFRYCFHMRDLLAQGRDDEFRQLFTSDKGLYLWLQYLACQRNIATFEDHINAEAQKQYNAALKGNHILQIVLFLICFPTLLYTAYYTRKTFKLTELLRKTEADKNEILTEQNLLLEKTVAERTGEIVAQNEELQSQSEEIASQRDTLMLQNKKLQEAQKIIEQQNQEILYKNDELETEVNARTHELKNANQELVEQNNQLEQFAFIAAHNLRAPLARIMGLAHILELAAEERDRTQILHKLVSSTTDLDSVIRDLNSILDIKKHTANLIEVDLRHALDRVHKTLEKEFEDTNATLKSELQIDKVYAVPPYVESVLYNLVSNAIKYRHPDRNPLITVCAKPEKDFVCLSVSDNGLGIDLYKHKSSMFNLYKRFHLHMEGRGLGLYLIKTQMIALGGRIDVESEPEKGSTFFAYFKR